MTRVWMAMLIVVLMVAFGCRKPKPVAEPEVPEIFLADGLPPNTVVCVPTFGMYQDSARKICIELRELRRYIRGQVKVD